MITRVRDRLNQVLGNKLAWVIFFVFFFLAFVIQSEPNALVSHYDPYYHISHSLSYITGETMQLPVLSTIQSPNGDLYLLYHLLLAPFVYMGEIMFDNPVLGAKIFQSLAVALVYLTFFLVSRNLLSYFGNLNRNRANTIALLFLLILWSIGTPFNFRLFLIRPEILILPLFLYGVLGTIKRHRLGLLSVGFLAPFLYSISFIVLLFPLSYLGAGIFVKKTWRPTFEYFSPLIYTAAGLVAGILLRPDTLYYLMNAYFSMFYILFLRLFSLQQPAELYSLGLVPNSILGILFFFLIVYFESRTRFYFKNSEKKLVALYSIFFLSAFLFFPTLFVMRAIVYSLPIFMFLFAIYYGTTLKHDLLALYEKKYVPEKIPLLLDILHAAYKHIYKFFPRALIILLVFLGSYMTIGMSNRHTQSNLATIEKASKIVEENTNEGDLVFNEPWHMYPQLQYINNKNRYAFGMAGIFTKLYSESTHAAWLDLLSSTTPSSPARTRELYEKVSRPPIVFIHTPKEIHSNLHDKLEESPDFSLLFAQEDAFDTYVYKYNPSTSTTLSDEIIDNN